MWTQETYLQALSFAARVHAGQKIPGGELPYVIHLCQVAMEVMACPEAEDLAVACALLHDTIEDTSASYDDVKDAFGGTIADGVLALTKNSALPKKEQMADSLVRIQKQPPGVWMVKLSDRITNLQKPPHYWSDDKRRAYLAEAEVIWRELGPANQSLSQRLAFKIESYQQYIGSPTQT